MELLSSIIRYTPRKLLRTISNLYEIIYYRFFYSKPKLDFEPKQRRYLLYKKDIPDNIIKYYQIFSLAKIQSKIAQADLICQHIFDLLGSGPKKLSTEGDGYQPIDWHIDFKNYFRWRPKIFYRHIKLGHIRGVDVKIPWELSRFQHLNVLGQAYLITKDKKYAKEFANQITDWIENNPVGFGVNWRCTMDVAIRAVNWLVAIEYFSEKDLFSQNFLKKLYTSIYEHAKFIQNHLEYSKPTTNHYIANIAGLFFIAVYCPFFKESPRWQKFALMELCRESEKQVYPDGCNFEASTSYHRLVLEMFFYSELLSKRAGIDLPQNYKNKVKKMFEFTLHCIKPNGMIPQIGDNDNGRFLVYCNQPVLDHKYLLTLATIYYKDSRFKLPNFDFNEEAFWIFGEAGKRLYDNLPFRIDTIASKIFPDAGWYIIRHKNNYCFISCGPNGQNGQGGHAHNDKLSFELTVDGQDIIIDPGTYSYTSYPDDRNRFRSTSYHNIVQFDAFEQNKISAKNIFILPQRVNIINAILKETNNDITFTGKIQYAEVRHKREITFFKKDNNWRIRDTAYCCKSLNGKLLFHLSPNVTFNNNDILIKNTNKKIASIEVKGHNLEKTKYYYSPEYGLKSEAECLLINISYKELNNGIDTYIKISK